MAKKKTAATRKTPKKTSSKGASRSPGKQSTKKKASRTSARKTADAKSDPKTKEVQVCRRRKDRRDEDTPEVESAPVESAPGESARESSADQPERRKKVNRRRQIDPTTCERDYTGDEIEFMQAMDAYKRSSGRMFPTCSEILEVVRNLGYVRQDTEIASVEVVDGLEGSDSPHQPGIADETLKADDNGFAIDDSDEIEATSDLESGLV